MCKNSNRTFRRQSEFCWAFSTYRGPGFCGGGGRRGAASSAYLYFASPLLKNGRPRISNDIYLLFSRTAPRRHSSQLLLFSFLLAISLVRGIRICVPLRGGGSVYTLLAARFNNEYPVLYALIHAIIISEQLQQTIAGCRILSIQSIYNIT